MSMSSDISFWKQITLTCTITFHFLFACLFGFSVSLFYICFVVGARGQVDIMLDSRSEGLGIDYHFRHISIILQAC